MRMRFFLPLFFFMAFVPLAAAQHPWNFATLDEACRSEAFLVDPPAELRSRLVEATGGSVRFNADYHLSGPYSRWGRKYIRLQNDTVDVRLEEGLAQELLPYLVSHSYWQQRFRSLLRWAYVDMDLCQGFLDVDTTNRTFGRYSAIQWLGYDFRPSEQWPVEFTLATNTRQPQQVTLRAVDRLAEWAAFATQASQLEYERNRSTLVREDSARRHALQAELDSLNDISLTAARTADSIAVEMMQDSLADAQAQLKEDVLRTKDQMNRNEIFFMSVRPARSEYMFGLEFNIYNCFKKPITKVELTVTPYNSRDRVQEDKFHRSVRTVRCMGPIHPGSPAQYTFDELFWQGDGKIKYMRVTSVTFHFTDGTTRTYSGYDRIMRHTLH